MTLKEIAALVEGDIIRCSTCSCDGSEQEVYFKDMPCGCLGIWHTENNELFAWVYSKTCARRNDAVVGSIGVGEGVDIELIELVKGEIDGQEGSGSVPGGKDRVDREAGE